MKAITLIVALFLSSTVFSQEQARCYSMVDESPEMNCYLFLTDKGDYCIELHFVYDDIVEIAMMSSGKYTECDTSLILTDDIHGYESFFQKDADAFVVVRSLLFLENKKFCIRGDDEMPEMGSLNSIRISDKAKEYNKKYSEQYRLVAGKYNSNNGYELVVRDDKVYILRFKNYLLSKGEWIRDHNILLLKDSNIECTFFLMIGKTSLTSNLLPGDRSSCLLKRVNESTVETQDGTGFGCSRRKR